MKHAALPAHSGPSAALQAQVLHGVLPYLQSIHGKTFVVVCEGGVLTEPALRLGLGRDVALLQLVGLQLVLFSGGTAASVSAIAHQQESLVGAVNQHGARAVGLTGMDGGPARLAGGLIQRLCGQGFVPVVMPLVEGAGGERALADADALACDVAVQLKAEKLLFLGDSPGALDGDGNVIAVLSVQEIESRRGAKTIAAAGLARLEAAARALAGGVKSAHLLDGRCLHALLLEVLSNSGGGTLVLHDGSTRFLDITRRYMG